MKRVAATHPVLWNSRRWTGPPTDPARSLRLALLAVTLLAAALLDRPGSALAHEPWLFSPEEAAVLQQEPLPPLFTTLNPLTAGLALLTAASGAMAWFLQRRLARLTALQRLTGRLRLLAVWSPLVLRLGLSALLLWSASKSALFFPELDLRQVGAIWVVGSEVTLALLLAFDPSTRVPALLVLALEGYGLTLFRGHLLPYLGVIAGPALYLAIRGGTASPPWRFLDWGSPWGRRLWALPSHLVRVLLGTHLVYIGIAGKYLAPSMFMAIIRRDQFPTFGLAPEAVTLLMGTIEVVLGAALAFGLLPRGAAVLLIGGFVIMAALLREDVLGHAIFIAMLLVIVIEGCDRIEDASAPAPTELRRRMAAKPVGLRRRPQPPPLTAA